MRKLLLIWPILFITITLKAQKDSLLKLLPIAKEDTEKVQLYIDIGNQYELNDLKNAGKYYLLAGELSKRLNYKKGLLKYISNYTGVLNQLGTFDSSLILNKQAIQLSEELNDDLLMAKAYANTGNVFQYTSVYDSALYYYEIAKKKFELVNDKIMLARMCNLLQNTYRELNQPEKALELSKEAVGILRTAKDSVTLGISLSNLGVNYTDINLDSALKNFNEAIIIARNLNYTELELACLINTGNIYLHKYDADKMKPYYEKALQISRQAEAPESELIACRGMAHYFLYKNNLQEAKKYISRSLFVSDSLGMRYEHVSNLKSLSAILYAMHDMAAAERCLDSASKIETQLNGDEIQKKTLTIEKKFETEKKEAQIELQQTQLRQRSLLNYFLIAGAIALLFILLLTYRNYRNRQKLQQAKIDELETEKQLTATEAVLKGEEQERSRLAKDLHDGLGGMLSGIKYSLSNMKENLIMTPGNAQAFERSIDMLDSSIKEMRRVAHNMMPEMLVKYGLNIALQEYCAEINNSGVVHINYQPIGMEGVNFEQTIALTIYRIVQELVNNTIKHAAAQNILVQPHVSDENKFISLTVEDDGNGFDIALLKDAKGIGWTNIQNRVEFLKGTIDIKSSPGNGTSILIEINI